MVEFITTEGFDYSGVAGPWIGQHARAVSLTACICAALPKTGASNQIAFQANKVCDVYFRLSVSRSDY